MRGYLHDELCRGRDIGARVDLLQHLVDERRPVQLCDAGREVSGVEGVSPKGGWIARRRVA